MNLYSYLDDLSRIRSNQRQSTFYGYYFNIGYATEVIVYKKLAINFALGAAIDYKKSEMKNQTVHYESNSINYINDVSDFNSRWNLELYNLYWGLRYYF